MSGAPELVRSVEKLQPKRGDVIVIRGWSGPEDDVREMAASLRDHDVNCPILFLDLHEDVEVVHVEELMRRAMNALKDPDA